jgi:hypothetical protein
MKVFTCKEFTGHWPAGTAAVVVADTAMEAARLLMEDLKAHGLAQDLDDLDMWEVPTHQPWVRILCDGNY